MLGTFRCVLIAGVASACNIGDIDPPPADGGGSGGGDTVLRVDWNAQPAIWPSTIRPGVTLERVVLRIDTLRVIGDAGPSDPRTTETKLKIEWRSDRVPSAIEFTEAPAGLFSQIGLQLDGKLLDDSYSLEGKATVGTEERDFRIEDEAPLPITIQINEMLGIGKTVTVLIDIDFIAALANVDFGSLRIEDGDWKLDQDDPGIVGFRQVLIQSFSGQGASAI